ncbi:MAG: hypothetical protein KME11_19020 [Timaviella obliquedivisa GSE-PSE-MK23-08B]|jgi:hypothetical protein|nr:hypothetical protein [Timaviella obliquedivisa GSE-PSE-MK23-08B]
MTEAITFEQAIALTQNLLTQLEQLSEPEIQAAIATLVSTENGARGFFVTYLTDDRSFVDQPTDAVIKALQTSPFIVAELLVKNLAMSTGIAIAHRRNSNEAMARGSDRVQRRTAELIQRVQLPEVAEKAAQLQASAETGVGEYQTFLERWGYDAEQRQQIAQVMGLICG